MKIEYYIGTSKVSKEVYDTVQVYKKENLLLAYENDKYKKTLEIIKNKKVNVRAFLKSCYYKDIDTQLNVYNSQCNDKEIMESKELTKEEYELLKEVLL